MSCALALAPLSAVGREVSGATIDSKNGENQRSFRIWDSHIHCYPLDVSKDPGDWARRNREPHWGRLVTDGPQGWAGPDALLQAMDRNGIERVLIQAWYWQNPETARRQNDWHADWVALHPDRLSVCTAIHPELRDPFETLQESQQWGACAIGECLPQVQSAQNWQHPAWEEVVNWASEQGWPMTVHLTEPASHDYHGRVETPLLEAVELFERFPKQKFIAAHWGGGLPFYSLNRRVKAALANVWFDTAASPLIYDQQVWRTVCDLVGKDKILFGSDFPLMLYPRLEQSPDWARVLAEFHNSGLTVAERQSIGKDNLAALLSIA